MVRLDIDFDEIINLLIRLYNLTIILNSDPVSLPQMLTIINLIIRSTTRPGIHCV